VSSVSDFIEPSQACVVSLNKGKLSADDAEVRAARRRAPARSRVLSAQLGMVQLRQAPASGFAAPRAATPGGPLKVSLHDCLACSGCVTSAEAVLLEHQSMGMLRAALADEARVVVVSVAPQARAAVAAALGLSPAQAAALLAAFFVRRLGVAAVLDAGAAHELALLEGGAELVSRLRGGGPLPLLASACPGWVCYAEKRHGETVLPHLSAVMSPQAVAGVLAAKLWPAATPAAAGRSVFHASVAPCFDRKLEASRAQLRDAAGAPGTDCVLTAGEVLEELVAACPSPERVALLAAEGAALLEPAWNCVAEGSLYSAPGGGAGGHAEAAAHIAARELWGVRLPPGPLPWQARAGAGASDFRELTLQPPPDAPTGSRPLRLAAVYGFRNIQTLVRMLKRGAAPYDYVEVMACPGGCTNGGGLPKPVGGQTPRDVLAAVDAAYASLPERQPGAHPVVECAYRLLGGGPGGQAARAAFHTSFAAVQAPPSASDW
jgi:iron only hydrogenase large subunit-like protein